MASPHLALLCLVDQVVTRKSGADTVSAVVGPAVLAVAALNLEYITYMQTANALFGYYLCEKLEVAFLTDLTPLLVGSGLEEVHALTGCTAPRKKLVGFSDFWVLREARNNFG